MCSGDVQPGLEDTASTLRLRRLLSRRIMTSAAHRCALIGECTFAHHHGVATCLHPWTVTVAHGGLGSLRGRQELREL